MFVINLTGGGHFSIEEKEVLRVQHAIPGVMKPGSIARVDAKSTFDVDDQPEAIADQVRAVVGQQLGILTLPNGNPVWFAGPATHGPIWIPDGEIGPRTKSAVLIAGKRMFVRNTPEDVARIVGEAGGYVLPLKTLWNDLEAGLPKLEDVDDWPDQQR